MSKKVWKGTTLMGPLPATIVTCAYDGRENALTIAWNGIINSKPPMTYVSVRKERFSHDIIEKSGEFCINLVNAKLLRAADMVGCISGKDIDKFDKTGLKKEHIEGYSVPVLLDSPVSLMCRVTQKIELPSHDMFIAEITDVVVNEELLDSKGALRIERADLIAFAHGQYFTLGKRLAQIGYSVRKKK